MDIIKKNLFTIAVELKRQGVPCVTAQFSGSGGRSDGLMFTFPGAPKYPRFTDSFTYFVTPPKGPASDGKPVAALRHGDFYTLVEDAFNEHMAAQGYANWAAGQGAEGAWVVTSDGEVQLFDQTPSPDDRNDDDDSSGPRM